MKKLICEICGDSDLIKQDNYYVCQSCGSKFTVEEAKKMLVEVEGTVNVQGTVKIDHSDSEKMLVEDFEYAIKSNNYQNALEVAKKLKEFGSSSPYARVSTFISILLNRPLTIGLFDDANSIFLKTIQDSSDTEKECSEKAFIDCMSMSCEKVFSSINQIPKAVHNNRQDIGLVQDLNGEIVGVSAFLAYANEGFGKYKNKLNETADHFAVFLSNVVEKKRKGLSEMVEQMNVNGIDKTAEMFVTNTMLFSGLILFLLDPRIVAGNTQTYLFKNQFSIIDILIDFNDKTKELFKSMFELLKTIDHLFDYLSTEIGFAHTSMNPDWHKENMADIVRIINDKYPEYSSIFAD